MLISKKTVLQLPRTPDEASVIPVQLKRKQAYRNAHLKEYISPSKIKQALSTLKFLGHKHYQFDFELDFDDFEKRMEIEDDLPQIHEVHDEILIDTNIFGDIHPNLNSINSGDSQIPVPELVQKIILEMIDTVLTEDEIEEDPREIHQFNYNLHTCFQDDHPEIDAEERTISLCPGEGKRPTSIIMDDEWDMKTIPCRGTRDAATADQSPELGRETVGSKAFRSAAS